MFLLFWAYEVSLLSIIFLIAALVDQPAASYVAGMVYILVGFFLQCVRASVLQRGEGHNIWWRYLP